MPGEIVKPIRVAIIEDIKEVAADLQEIFNQESDLICEKLYFNAEDAIHFLPSAPVDVVLVDIGLPNIDGISAIIALRESCKNTLFCMFTVFEDNDKIFSSLKAGAKGYILKNSKPEKIVAAIRELYHGGSPMTPDIARKVINAFSTSDEEKARALNLPLTEREYQLLDILAEGKLYKEIAAELNISTGTVKQHIHKIYHKLQVNNRTEAINKYLRR